MPEMASNGMPILGIDVWEHAYYHEYQTNVDYVDAFFKVISTPGLCFVAIRGGEESMVIPVRQANILVLPISERANRNVCPTNRSWASKDICPTNCYFAFLSVTFFAFKVCRFEFRLGRSY